MVNINLKGPFELCCYIQTIVLQKGSDQHSVIFDVVDSHARSLICLFIRITMTMFPLFTSILKCTPAYTSDISLIMLRRGGWWSSELVFWVWVPKSIYYTSQTTEVNNIANKNTVQCSRRCHQTHSGTKW